MLISACFLIARTIPVLHLEHGVDGANCSCQPVISRQIPSLSVQQKECAELKKKRLHGQKTTSESQNMLS